MNKKRSIRILTLVVISYMLLALFWWAILLFKKNNENYKLQIDLITSRHQELTKEEVLVLPEMREAAAYYQRQMNMIVGEAIVFGIILIVGIYLINRAFFRELEAADKQKNFLLSITHELRSPLASINLIFSTLKSRKLPQDKVEELSEDGLAESTRLEDLFNKILIATRLNKAYQFNLEENNLSDISNDVISRFEKYCPGIELKRNIESDIIYPVDREAFQSLLKNLLENACKYSKDPKKITVDVHRTKESKVEIAVSDNGVGIPKEERQKVFDQFYRVGQEETRQTKGTGLGLYIVKKIVNAHKGKISIAESSLGGTKFKIII